MVPWQGGYVRSITGFMKSDMVKVLAAREARSWLKSLQKDYIVLETDCQKALVCYF